MKRIIGLDLGTTSIGWALVNEKENDNESSSIVGLGVRQVSLTVDEKNNYEKGKAVTTNAERRTKRGMRRNLQRYKLRRKVLRDCLIENGIISEDSVMCEDGPGTTFETHRLRAKAVESEITLEEFARVLFMINKKRGYKSNRKVNSDEEGELIDGIDVAEKLNAENITPGQLLYRKFCREGKRSNIPFYRSDLQKEFDHIVDLQSQYYPEILDEEMKSALHSGGKPSDLFKAKNVLSAKNSGKYAQELEWRAKAAVGQLDIDQVAYVLGKIHSAINGASQYLGMISDRSKELHFNHQTVGQMQYQLLCENRHNRLKNITFYRQDYLDEFDMIWKKQASFHPELTPELKKEVCDIAIFYQRDLKSCKGLVSFCELEHREIAVTTPDGRQKTVTTGSRVCPKSSPLFQDFRIWQRLNDIMISFKGSTRKKANKSVSQLELFDDVVQLPRFLSQEEKEILYGELSMKSKMSKKGILSLFFDNPDKFDLNFKDIDGNTTMAALYGAYQEIISRSGHGDYDFSKMRAETVKEIVHDVFAALGYNTDILSLDPLLPEDELQAQPAYKLWHLLYSYSGDKSATGNESLYRKISQLCGFEKEYAAIVARVKLQPDYGSLSTKAMRRILPFMMKGSYYSDACDKAGYNHSVRSLTKEQLLGKEFRDQIDLLPKNSLRNPVVEKILNQMINVVNSISAKYGKPDEIRIELARELKKSQKEREGMKKAIDENTKESNRIREILETRFHISRVTKNDITRYRLYEELKGNGYNTLYSNTHISEEELFSNKFDIEHILPQARVFDDSFSNKTLESRDINIEKGSRTAMDYVREKYGDDGEMGTEQYTQRVYNLSGTMSRTKIRHLLMTESEIPDGFIERDLRETQYIAKKAHEILEQMAPVTATTGSITSRLREDWQLVNIMQELNWDIYDKKGITETYEDKDGHPCRRIKDWTKRNDHRHHAMDALTIAFTKPSIIQYLNHLNARNDKQSEIYGIECKELHRNSHNKLVFNAPKPINEFRAEAKKHIEDILISIKSKNKVVTRNTNHVKTKGGHKDVMQLTPRGALSEETIYGRTRAGEFTQRIAVQSFAAKKLKPVKDIINNVLDEKVKNILLMRLEKHGNDPKRAFENLDNNPVWLNEENGIAIKKVKMRKKGTFIPLHTKNNHKGESIVGDVGMPIPNDYVQTGGNHHIAIFRDEKGKLQEHVVTFFEATVRATMGLPAVDRDYNLDKGWHFLFTMKKNEYFVFPNNIDGFDPNGINLKDPANFTLISPNLFRAQQLSSKDYYFRHHLDTTTERSLTLKDVTWKRMSKIEDLKGIVKVRVNHIGEIVDVGEY
jgi:CRISPR-associated endonuclease Csn1